MRPEINGYTMPPVTLDAVGGWQGEAQEAADQVEALEARVAELLPPADHANHLTDPREILADALGAAWDLTIVQGIDLPRMTPTEIERIARMVTGRKITVIYLHPAVDVLCAHFEDVPVAAVEDGEQYGVRFSDGHIDWIGRDVTEAFGDGVRELGGV